MPIHDWTRAPDYAFHDFHLRWMVRLASELNAGVLPQPCYALNETLELRPTTGLAELPESDGPDARSRWEDELRYDTPRAAFRATDERRQYACPVVTVRGEFHQPVAVVLAVSRQDKTTPYRLDRVTEFAVAALTRHIHLLLIDLFPPGDRDPGGAHDLVWGRVTGGDFRYPPGKRLVVASYSADGELAAFVEPLAVDDALPDMPLFLTELGYVPCPLEATYAATWAVCPEPIRELVEQAPSESE